ncbi:hypothetical protein [Hyphomicrobium sp. ghe19]|uniref:hypothetical protein n=1 Tax=Hyphomicrobium sp. ghe19 TaxID=2682968 RepID=UPI0030D1815A
MTGNGGFGINARRQPLGASALQQGLDGIEGLLIDDSRHLECDPLRWRPSPSAPAVEAVEVMFAAIRRRRQQIMHPAGREATAAAGDTTFVEIGGDGLDAERPTMSTGREVEDQSHYPGFVVTDDKHFLVLRPSPFLHGDGVAEGRP